MASRRYQPGDRLLPREPGDARRRRVSDGYEYDIFPQRPTREAHPPKRWRYQEEDSPSLLSEGSSEDASRRPSPPKEASFWSTPSSRRPSIPRGSAARSSAARPVHVERDPSESSESSERADVPEASTTGVGRRPTTPRSSGARSSSERPRPAEREPSPRSFGDDEGPAVSPSSFQRRSAVPEASSSSVGRRPATPRSFGLRSSAGRPRPAEREPSPRSSGDDEGPAVSASSVQRRSAGAEPTPERRPPTPARQAPVQPSPAARQAPVQPSPAARQAPVQPSRVTRHTPMQPSPAARQAPVQPSPAPRQAAAQPSPAARQAPAQPSPAARRARAPPAEEPTASKGPSVGRRRRSTPSRRGNSRSKKGIPAWLKNVRHLQRTTHLLIPRLSFARLVREILQGLAPSRADHFYMQGLALQALQEASEHFVMNFLSASYLCSAHAKRKTLMRPDMVFLRNLLKSFGANLATAL